jgi:hypothetical protein
MFEEKGVGLNRRGLAQASADDASPVLDRNIPRNALVAANRCAFVGFCFEGVAVMAVTF